MTASSTHLILSETKPITKVSPRKIIALLDWDGTFSGRDGSRTVYSELYCSVHKRTKPVLDKKGEPVLSARTGLPLLSYVEDATFLEKPEMLALLRKGFLDKSNSDMGLPPGGKDTLLYLLANNAEINVVSKNHAQWIQAVLEIEKFTAEQIKKIAIYDVKNGGGLKYQTASSILNKPERELDPNAIVLVLDDSREDFNAMHAAVKELHRGIVIAETAPAGKFNFPAILDKVTKNVHAAPALFADVGDIIEEAAASTKPTVAPEAFTVVHASPIQPKPQRVIARMLESIGLASSMKHSSSDKDDAPSESFKPSLSLRK